MNKRRRRSSPSRQHKPASSCELIYGIHAVLAALANPERQVLGLYATQNGLGKLRDAIEDIHVSAVETSADDLSRRLGRDAVHQGVMIEAAPLEAPELDTVLASLAGTRPLIVLDQVTDPHNVGAVLRSAAVFNAAGLIMTRRNSPPLDGVLAKAASGAVEHVPIILITNLARTLDELKQSGVLTIGLDGDAGEALEAAQLQFPCALVLGAEGRGLRRLTAENCDFLCRLTTSGPLRSLNVSNAAAVALHTLAMRVR